MDWFDYSAVVSRDEGLGTPCGKNFASSSRFPNCGRKILLTLVFLAIYRIGWQIPLPIVDLDKMTRPSPAAKGASRTSSTQVAIFSASQLNQATIFGLGIMPYISASIIFQLLGSVWKPMEELQKEGESGRKKINEYTRYATVGLCLMQSWMYVRFLRRRQDLD